jgi:hypothetical protein
MANPVPPLDASALAFSHNSTLLQRMDAQPESTELASTPAASDASELAKKLSNPISDLISIPIQFNYDEGYGPKNGDRYTLNIQPVIPFSISDDWNLISRTIVPLIYQGSPAEGVDSKFALGDVTQSLFFSPKEPIGGWIVGVGPVILLPTGTSPSLRSENFGLGPTIVALRQQNGWTVGALANHVWGVTSSDDRDEVSSTFIQPFLAYSWPTATTLTLNTETLYDWNSEQWTVPVNILLSQVVRIGNQPVSLQVGYRWYAESAENAPDWGIRFAVTFMFPR